MEVIIERPKKSIILKEIFILTLLLAGRSSFAACDAKAMMNSYSYSMRSLSTSCASIGGTASIFETHTDYAMGEKWVGNRIHCVAPTGSWINGWLSYCIPSQDAPDPASKPPRCPKNEAGSVIEIDRGVLGESVPIVGTGYSLVYRTDRDRARKFDRIVRIPIHGDETEAGATGYNLDITYDGGTDTLSFPLIPGQVSTYEWSGKNRSLQESIGGMEITFASYVAPVPSNPNWVLNPYKNTVAIGHYNAMAAGLGGWTFSPYHFYDSVTQRLFKGDGSTLDLKFQALVAGELRVVDESGTVWYKFDPSGYHLETRTALEDKLLMSFAHNSQMQLSSMTNAYGKVTTITRDSNGRFTGIQTPYGQQTTITLNSSGKLATVTDPAGALHAFTYHTGGSGLLASYVRPGGQTNTYSYDPDGFLLSDERTNGQKLTLSTNLSGTARTVTSQTREGRQEVININSKFWNGRVDQLRSYTSVDGTSESAEETAVSQKSISGQSSKARTFTDDPRFGPLHQTLATVTNDSNGIVHHVAIATSATLSVPNDPFSYSTINKTYSEGSNSATSVYSRASRTWTNTSFEGRISSNIFDTTYERLIETKEPSALATALSYDSDGRLSAVTQGARSTSYFYNADGYLSRIRNSLNQDTEFEYDLGGRLKKQIHPDGKEINYTYDLNGKLLSITPPNGLAHSFTYQADSETLSEYLPPTLTGVLDPTTNYTYDLDGLVTQVDRPTGLPVLYAYIAGSTKLASVGIGSTSQYIFNAYDSNGIANAVTSPYDLKSEWTRKGEYVTSDKLTNLAIPRVYGEIEIRYPSSKTQPDRIRVKDSGGNYVGSIDYAYDKDGLLTQAGALNFVRSATTGQITSASIGSLTEAYTYDNYGSIASYAVGIGSTTIYSYSINRDNLGRIANWTETVSGTPKTEYFTYDGRGRLTDIYIGGVQQSRYNYSFNSNALSGKVRGTNFTATYDAQDRIKTWNNLSFTYNWAGERLSQTDSSISATVGYLWDFMGHLREVQKANGDIIKYKYDGKQRRAQILVNGNSAGAYLYQDQLKPVAEMSGLGSMNARFVWGSRNVPEYIQKGGIDYRIISDPRDSVRLVVNTSTGMIVQRINYNEWGWVSSDTSPGFQPFGFAGGLYDYRTGLVQFGARHYDSVTGKWLSKDPILFDGGDTNLYGYVGNDPTNFIDPSGLIFPVGGGQGGVPAPIPMPRFPLPIPLPLPIPAPTDNTNPLNPHTCPQNTRESRRKACKQIWEAEIAGCHRIIDLELNRKCQIAANTKLAECMRAER